MTSLMKSFHIYDLVVAIYICRNINTDVLLRRVQRARLGMKALPACQKKVLVRGIIYAFYISKVLDLLVLTACCLDGCPHACLAIKHPAGPLTNSNCNDPCPTASTYMFIHKLELLHVHSVN